MTTLRDRLLALADDCELIRGDLVLAAARMALEDAERKIWERANAVGCNPVALVADCTGYIRALREGLA